MGREPISGPGSRSEESSVRFGVAGREIVAVFVDPSAQAPVEKGRPSTEHAEHHDQPAGGHPSGVVVGDHPSVVADTESTHRLGELVRRRQGMTSVGGTSVGGQIGVDVDEHRTGYVSTSEHLACVSSVEVPANVGHDHVQ